jgi:hypothetical protein
MVHTAYLCIYNQNHKPDIPRYIYRVIKKSLCTWWLQYRKLQVMFKVSHSPVSRHLLTHQTVFSKTVFNIAWSKFQMCFVMAVFKSSTVWGMFKYCSVTVMHIFFLPFWGNFWFRGMTWNCHSEDLEFNLWSHLYAKGGLHILLID